MAGSVPGGSAERPRHLADGIDIFWIPVGAGGRIVRWSCGLYELLAAAAARRRPVALYHAALAVHRAGVTTTVEMAPVWTGQGERGVVGEGPVGLRPLGRSRLFRYELRCWIGGAIPDEAAAVGGPVRVSADPLVAAAVLAAVPRCPTPIWGRDELGVGEMWNSNSVVAWVLCRGGVDVAGLGPPAGGRAPGWMAGLAAARADGPRRSPG